MASPSSNNGIASGFIRPQSTWGDYNQIVFIISELLSLIQTVTLVRVLACSNDGDTSPVGTVTVQPLVNQVDGNGNGTPHGSIFNLPYLRVQGGTNAVIIDPQAGDIGIALFCNRDISVVKKTKGQANPGTTRQFDWGDGLYVGGVLNGSPTQYVQFNTDGIQIVSTSKITLTAPTIELDGDVTMTQTLAVTDDITSGQISLQQHKHTSAAAGQPTSEPLP